QLQRSRSRPLSGAGRPAAHIGVGSNRAAWPEGVCPEAARPRRRHVQAATDSEPHSEDDGHDARRLAESPRPPAVRHASERLSESVSGLLSRHASSGEQPACAAVFGVDYKTRRHRSAKDAKEVLPIPVIRDVTKFPISRYFIVGQPLIVGQALGLRRAPSPAPPAPRAAWFK